MYAAILHSMKADFAASIIRHAIYKKSVFHWFFKMLHAWLVSMQRLLSRNAKSLYWGRNFSLCGDRTEGFDCTFNVSKIVVVSIQSFYYGNIVNIVGHNIRGKEPLPIIHDGKITMRGKHYVQLKLGVLSPLYRSLSLLYIIWLVVRYNNNMNYIW